MRIRKFLVKGSAVAAFFAIVTVGVGLMQSRHFVDPGPEIHLPADF